MNEDNNIDIAKKWFDFADSINNIDNQKEIFEFVVYWIAFNRLYNSCPNDEKEWKMVRNYIRDKYESNQEYFKKLHECTDNSDVGYIIKYPILNSDDGICKSVDYKNKRINNISKEWSLKIYQDYHGKNKHDVKEKSEDLFEMIYKVRCNLIHGGKKVDVNRDRELIKASRNILKSFLEQVAFK